MSFRDTPGTIETAIPMCREDSVSASPRSTLSVILPNYNHGWLLGRAVGALMAQERAPDEIILVDDGSTDDSARVLSDITANYPLVRVLFNEANKGVIYSLTRGLEASSGQYVYLAAADDWVLPGFFTVALPVLERHQSAGFVCGEAKLVSGSTGRDLGIRPAVRPSQRTACFPPSTVVEMLKHSDNWILTGSTIFRRDRIVEAGGLLPDLGSFADGFLSRKLALMFGFCFIPRPVAIWEIFANSASRQTASNPVEAQRTLVAALSHFDAEPCFPPWYAALFSRRWKFAISRLAVLANPINDVILFQFGVRTRFDKFVVLALLRFKLVGLHLPLLLAWLWFQFRPMNLAALVWTYVSRLSERGRGGGHPAGL